MGRKKVVRKFPFKLSVRNARVSDDASRMDSLGLDESARELNQIMSSSPKSNKTNIIDMNNKPKWKDRKVDLTPTRRSRRLEATYSNKNENQSPCESDLEQKHSPKVVERFGGKRDYESIRNARISENKARMESLGMLHSARELNQIISSSPKSNKTNTIGANNKPKLKDRKVELTPIRRSRRLEEISSNKNETQSPCKSDLEEEDVPVPDPDRRARLARRCDSKGRGSVYDPIIGICCHFCRQKKLCGEEDCKRCGNGDVNQPCIGKTECSVCHSSNGILCRACLKVRYGEEMEEVRSNKKWMCPHCIEEKAINPFWICNSSFCLKKRNLVPTGIAIYQARAQGYKSVAHLLMDQLKSRAAIRDAS